MLVLQYRPGILYFAMENRMKRICVAAVLASLVSTANAQQLPSVASSSRLPMLADSRYTVEGSYWVSWAYSAIGLKSAWTYNSATNRFSGFTGRGTTVAVFDTGLNTANSKFTGNLVNGYNLYTGGNVTSDPGWHGTFVAGIIGANVSSSGGSTMYGVAPETKIMPIQIFDNAGRASWTDAQMGRAINFAVANGAQILNNSWNISTTLPELNARAQTNLRTSLANQIRSWQTAASRGTLIVFAAGNDGKANPGYYATMPSLVGGLDKNWVVAVATTQTGEIASWSNKCGIAAAYCMAAPGDNIVSLYGTKLAVGSGTSFAAPIISAAASLMFQRWPWLKGQDIQRILFDTANKTGIYADTNTYGQGMLDLNKAFAPIGTPTVVAGPSNRTVNSIGTPITNAGINPSSAFGPTILNAMSKVDVMALDDYKRDYTYNMGQAVGSVSKLNNWGNQLAMFGANETYENGVATMQGGANGLTSMFSSTDVEENESAPSTKARYGTNMYSPGVSFLQADDSKVSSTNKLARQAASSGGRSSVGMNVSPTLGYGTFANNSIRGSDLVILNSVGNPYMNMAPDSVSAVSSYKWNNNHVTRFGAFSNTAINNSPNNYINGMVPLMTGVNLEHTIRWNGGYVSASGGVVTEQNSVLGSYSTGAISLGNRAHTAFAGLTLGLNLSDTVSAFAGATGGYTITEAAPDSIVRGVRNLTSSNAYAGVVKTGVFTDQDRLGVVLSTPMRVNTGVLALSVPSTRDIDGNITYTNQNVTLHNNRIEYASQVFYTLPIDAYQSVGFGQGVRFNAYDLNNPNQRTEMISMARYNLRF